MKFTALSSNLLLSIIGALLLQHSAPASALPNCTSNCGNPDTNNLKLAQKTLLDNIGCGKRDLGIIYKGGRTSAKVPDTAYEAAISEAGANIYLSCEEVWERFETIATTCSSQGGGYDTKPGSCVAVACNSTTTDNDVGGGGSGGGGEGDWLCEGPVA